ncbi:twin-arginine translocase subunit TatC [Cereibacter sphaeroides]|uniref:twin-arginine translocase subunit TatC n=1 Tax=Rhodobacterales TaxID=204455 RepID=UPI000BBF02C6|nr:MULTISPECIES: twin-arginine translocase subunit TatC [Paracoccaceae]MCE6953363.1 twin-arginine translocase subunit TatC [Cereibacter sphaeroides]MCE6960344.1 twin-arginine translocase subunit TatC [Cereibacter sphaeroides]MCE6969293.1 twin-arginine translocase subunit TatC [Cereibacter sphaeroides]MCE6975352.1 twin-arginine translocase subunit TatC [Cereibacter sphaeroides]
MSAERNDDIDSSSAPLIEHLAELRNRILVSLAAFLVGMAIAFTVWNPIFNFLTHPICDALNARGQDCGLVLIKLQEGFFVAIRISVMGGIVLSFPVIASQMWRFVAPGLYRSEKAAFLPFLIASPVMFILGGLFSFYVVLPIAFDFFLGFQQFMTEQPGAVGADGSLPLAGVVFQGSMEQYLALTTNFILAFGLCFQLPVLLTLMGKAGLVTSRGLAGMRKYAIVLILIVAAVVTPPDMMSQLILFAAIYPLYEASIFLIRRIEKKREAELRAQGLWFDDEEEDGTA